MERELRPMSVFVQYLMLSSVAGFGIRDDVVNERWLTLLAGVARGSIHISVPRSSLDILDVSYELPSGWSMTVSDGCLHTFNRPDAYLILLPWAEPLDSTREETQESLLERIKKLRCAPSAWNPNGRFVVLVKTNRIRNVHTTVREMIDVMWRNSVFKVIVMVEVVGRAVELYTADPFDEWNECGKRALVTRRLNSELREADPFHDFNLTEFPGCFLKVSWRESPPFSFVEPNGVTLTGLDVWLVELAASRSGWKLVWEERTSADKGDTATLEQIHAYYASLERAEIDIAVGGVEVLHEYWDVVRYTQLTTVQSLTFFVAGARLMPVWKTLYAMFMPTLWSAVVTTFVLSVLLLHAYSRWKSRESSDLGASFLTVFAIITERAVKYPSTPSIRAAVGALILYSYAISILYSSLLSALTARRPTVHQIHTLDELMEANVTVVMTKVTEKMISGVTSERGRQVLRYRLPSTPIKTALAELETSWERALLEREFSVQYLVKKGGLRVSRVIPGVLNIHNALVLTRGSLYYDRIGFFASAFLENGLKVKWKSELLGRPRYPPTKQAQPNVLTLNNLQVMFSVLLVGYVLSSVTMVLESLLAAYVRYRKMQLKNRISTQLFYGPWAKGRLLVLRLD